MKICFQVWIGKRCFQEFSTLEEAEAVARAATKAHKGYHPDIQKQLSPVEIHKVTEERKIEILRDFPCTLTYKNLTSDQLWALHYLVRDKQRKIVQVDLTFESKEAAQAFIKAFGPGDLC